MPERRVAQTTMEAYTTDTTGDVDDGWFDGSIVLAQIQQRNLAKLEDVDRRMDAAETSKPRMVDTCMQTDTDLLLFLENLGLQTYYRTLRDHFHVYSVEELVEALAWAGYSCFQLPSAIEMKPVHKAKFIAAVRNHCKPQTRDRLAGGKSTRYCLPECRSGSPCRNSLRKRLPLPGRTGPTSARRTSPSLKLRAPIPRRRRRAVSSSIPTAPQALSIR